MFFKEFVFVVSEICYVDDLVEVLSGFLSLFVWVRVGPIVSEVVGSTVCGIDHEGGFDQLFFSEVCGEGPHV